MEKRQEDTFWIHLGHAAFTSMRARGTCYRDITILVVAADDGCAQLINTQKRLTFQLALLSRLINQAANPERVIENKAVALLGWEWIVEICTSSTKTRDELLETVLLVAKSKNQGTQITVPYRYRSMVKCGKGAVATLLKCTFECPRSTVVGNGPCVRNDLGRRVKVAHTVWLSKRAPMAGDHFAVYEDEKSARAARRTPTCLETTASNLTCQPWNLFDTLKLWSKIC